MPTLRTPSPVRVVRAVIVSGVAAITGTTAHVAASGRVPGPIWLVPLFAVTCLATFSLLAAQASTWRLVVLVVLGQAGWHLVLTAAAGHEDDLPASPPAGRLAPHHELWRQHAAAGSDRRGSFYELSTAGHGSTIRPGQLVVPDWVVHVVQDVTGPHALMALGHLVVAGLIAVWLSVGERALWALMVATASTIVAAVARLFGLRAARSTLGSRPTRVRAVAATVARPFRDPMAAGVTRRGPPAYSCA